MDKKYVLALIGVLVLGSGIAMAISEASSVTDAVDVRWDDSTSAASVAIEGGNISETNVSGVSLTERWASFWGAVSGSINLTDGTNYVYSWAWTPATGGEVCVSQDPSFPFTDGEVTTEAELDAAFTFATGADTVTATYTDATYAVTLAETGTLTTTGTALQGSSTFDNAAIGDGVEAAEVDFAFCADIDAAGTNYAGVGADYEIMVPTSDGSTDTETYYFFVELN